MHVPADLSQRLTLMSRLHGRSAELLLREALTQWLAQQPVPAVVEAPVRAETAHLQFIPQPWAFSVYE